VVAGFYVKGGKRKVGGELFKITKRHFAGELFRAGIYESSKGFMFLQFYSDLDEILYT
jgi:hypothetical protein